MADNFDPDQYLAEKPAFDPDAYLADSEQSLPISELKPTQEINPTTKAQIVGAATAGAVESGRRAAAGLGEVILNRIGQLTPEQRSLISQDPEAYRKARPMEELLDSFRDLGQRNRQSAFDFRRQGVESLEGLEPVKGTDVLASLDVGSAPKMELLPEDLPKARPDTNKVSRFEKLLQEKNQLEASLRSIEESGLESFDLDKQSRDLNKKLENVNTRLSKDFQGILKESVIPSIKPTAADFARSTNIPEELLQVNPSLATRKIPEELGAVLRKEVDFLKTGEIQPRELANYVRKLQDQASYMVAPSEADKFRQGLARNVSEFLKELPGAEEYKKGQELSKKAIELEKNFKEFGLGLDSDGNVKISNPKKIENLYKSGNQKEITRLNKYITEAQELGVNMDSLLPPNIDRFQNELPLAAIRNEVASAKELPGVGAAKRFLGTAIGGSQAGVPGAVAGYTAAATLPTGTKLQELAAQAAGSTPFKTAAKASKFLGPAAGLLAASTTYADATDQGLGDVESVGLAAAEVANPIPFTDTIGAYKAAKEEFKREPGVIAPAAAGAKAFVKPMTELQKDIENKAGMSGADLLRAERGATTPVVKFESTRGPEMLEFADFLAQSDDKAAQEYSRVLRQISSSPDREKSAALFSLNQNPAFRNLAAKFKGSK